MDENPDEYEERKQDAMDFIENNKYIRNNSAFGYGYDTRHQTYKDALF